MLLSAAVNFQADDVTQAYASMHCTNHHDQPILGVPTAPNALSLAIADPRAYAPPRIVSQAIGPYRLLSHRQDAKQRVAQFAELHTAKSQGDKHHGKRSTTRQSRNQETEKGQGKGDRGSSEPQGRGVAARFRSGQEEIERREGLTDRAAAHSDARRAIPLTS
jgi:hypothetical protein